MEKKGKKGKKRDKKGKKWKKMKKMEKMEKNGKKWEKMEKNGNKWKTSNASADANGRGRHFLYRSAFNLNIIIFIIFIIYHK